jgi:hypothetical protein
MAERTHKKKLKWQEKMILFWLKVGSFSLILLLQSQQVDSKRVVFPIFDILIFVL